MGKFENFYNASLQQPLLLWVGIVVGIIFIFIKLDKARLNLIESNFGRFILFWALTSAIDAWLTANTVMGFGHLRAPYSTAIPTLFVILGDFRVFLLVHLICESSQDFSKKASFFLGNIQSLFLRSLLWTLPVPILSFAFVDGLLSKHVSPELKSRILFLMYEMFFVAWILIFRRKVSKRLVGDPVRWNWARSVIHFSVFYYGLWALADLWILTLPPVQMQDLGFLLRCLPNLLYYAGWAPWVVWGYFKYHQPLPKLNLASA